MAMLILLLLAFAGALTLKAFEERQSSEASILAQQAREADALAGHVRAELVSIRARMEGLLLSSANLETIRRNVPFDAVSEREPPQAVLAQLSDGDLVRVYAQDRSGRWISGARSSEGLLPEALGGRTLVLVSANEATIGARFHTLDDGERIATACSAVAQSTMAACVSRASPLLGMSDLNRILIYGLLIAAPLLAVLGLVQTIRRIGADAAHASDTANRRKNAFDPSVLRAFEVPALIGMWRWDPAMQLITIGPEAAHLLGSARSGEMSLDEFTSLISEDERRKVCTALEDATPVRQIDIAFGGANRSAGHVFEMMGAASEGAITGVLLNVTDRIQAQHRSRRAEALARAALDAHPGPFAVWDARKRLTHWNAAFPRVLNLDKSVVQAGASYDLIMSEVSKFVRVERPLGDDVNAREILLLSDHWVRLVDRKTASGGLITVGVDISNLKHHESTLARSERRLRSIVAELERARGQAQELAAKYDEKRAEAERANQAKTVFLGKMSHELRTPLNAINGFSDMMLKEVFGPLGDPRYKGYAEDINRSGEHLLQVITDLLDMAKIESGQMRISPKLIDPSEAVDSAVRMIRRHTANKQLSLVFDPDDDLPEISGDHLAIKQMTLNLISNASKFTEPGGEIRVTMSHENDWVVIRVADTGIGIAEEDLPRLAQPFTQVGTSARNAQGTGLGLALTKSFAEMHGGYIDIASKLGEGTTVSIYLPVPRDNAPRTASDQRTAELTK